MPTGEQTPVGDLKRAPFALVHPLDEFYQEMGLALPPLQQVDGEVVPQPYKQLLVHHDDMTPTLEKYHGRDIHLRLLSRRRKGSSYFREVVLLLDGTEQPVEFGAIRIYLDRFGAEARRQILEEQRPLGHILEEGDVKHSSRPKAFLRLASDHFINDALQLSGANVLYGRRNTLFDPQERSLAEIVEILPPVTAGRKE
jgi:chorismate-pyruvate lyase